MGNPAHGDNGSTARPVDAKPGSDIPRRHRRAPIRESRAILDTFAETARLDVTSSRSGWRDGLLQRLPSDRDRYKELVF